MKEIPCSAGKYPLGMEIPCVASKCPMWQGNTLQGTAQLLLGHPERAKWCPEKVAPTKDSAVEGWTEERREKGVPSMATHARGTAPMGKLRCRQQAPQLWVQGSAQQWHAERSLRLV